MSGSYRKTFEVVKATKRDIDGVTVNGKEMKFGRSGGFRVSDEGVAREIQQTVGYGRNSLGKGGTGEVVVMATDDAPAEPGHRYTFSVPEMPWKEYDERGRVIRRNDGGGEQDGTSELQGQEKDEEEQLCLSGSQEQEEPGR